MTQLKEENKSKSLTSKLLEFRENMEITTKDSTCLISLKKISNKSKLCLSERIFMKLFLNQSVELFMDVMISRKLLHVSYLGELPRNFQME